MLPHSTAPAKECITDTEREQEKKRRVNIPYIFYNPKNNQRKRHQQLVQMTFSLNIYKGWDHQNFIWMPSGKGLISKIYAITGVTLPKINYWSNLPVLMKILFSVKGSAVLKLPSSICLADLPLEIQKIVRFIFRFFFSFNYTQREQISFQCGLWYCIGADSCADKKGNDDPLWLETQIQTLPKTWR